MEPAQRAICGQCGGILGGVEAWPELVELFEYKVRDVMEGRVPSGGHRSLRALRYTLLGAALPPPLHRRVVVADRNEIRQYVFLTNQITVTPAKKAAANAGFGELDFTQFSNAAALVTS